MYDALPLTFELNRGQSDPRARFVARGHGGTLFLTGTDAVLTLDPPAGRPQNMKAHAVALRLVGANPAPRVAGQDQLAGRVNYLIGRDRGHWLTNIPTYARVSYQSVYPGIDLVYHGRQGQLEYDYMVAPGANPRAIRLSKVMVSPWMGQATLTLPAIRSPVTSQPSTPRKDILALTLIRPSS